MRTSVVPSKILHCVASKLTVYPASQNFAVARREACARPGTMCALVASWRSHGMSTLHVCVDLRVAPSGSVIVIGWRSSCLLMTWAPSIMKWLVAPESLSAVAVVLRFSGGPSVGTWCSSSSSRESDAKWLMLRVDVAGVVESGKHGKHVCLDLVATFHAPPCQACSGVGLVGMMILWTLRSLQRCPCALYPALLARVHPS